MNSLDGQTKIFAYVEIASDLLTTNVQVRGRRKEYAVHQGIRK